MFGGCSGIGLLFYVVVVYKVDVFFFQFGVKQFVVQIVDVVLVYVGDFFILFWVEVYYFLWDNVQVIGIVFFRMLV